MIQPILEMKDVVKFYGDKPVLQGVSFRVLKGETKIIIGASGSGKSTILKLIMGLDKPDEGAILVAGKDITGLNERQLVEVTAGLDRQPVALAADGVDRLLAVVAGALLGGDDRPLRDALDRAPRRLRDVTRCPVNPVEQDSPQCSPW